MRTHGYHDDNYTAHIKRIKRQALKARRLAYHLVDGTYSSAERHEPGFYRFFPGNSQYGKPFLFQTPRSLRLAVRFTF